MSRIDDLIAEACPNGVPFERLGDMGELVRGNGMPKADFTASGVGAIHYGQIYTYYGTWATETISFVSPEKATRLAKVDPGDIVIKNTSENLDDVGKAVAWMERPRSSRAVMRPFSSMNRTPSSSPIGCRPLRFIGRRNGLPVGPR